MKTSGYFLRNAPTAESGVAPCRTAIVAETCTDCSAVVESLRQLGHNPAKLLVLSVASPGHWSAPWAGLVGLSLSHIRQDALDVATRAAHQAVEHLPGDVPVEHAASHCWREALETLEHGGWDVVLLNDAPTRRRDRRALSRWLRARSAHQAFGAAV